MENLKKKLLIIAGAEVHSKIVTAAKELGYYTIVTDNLSPEDAPAKRIADEFWMINIMETDEIIEKCKKENIDGILAFCIDPAQIPYYKIATALNLPCYGNKEAFEIFTNKIKFKNFCKQHKVGVIPSYSYEEVFEGKAVFPLLIKPSVSRGSRGQTVCFTLEEVKEAVNIAKKESKDGDCIIEKYMENAQDMSFSYIVINKEPFLLKIGDRYLGKKEDNLEKQHMATFLPSVHLQEFLSKVEPRVKKMIKALNMDFGAVFLQGLYENGEVYFYDPGLRFPGSDFDLALKKTTEFDTMKSFVNFAMSNNPRSTFGNPNEAFKLGNYNCLILSISCAPGKIKEITGFEKIKQNPNILSASLRYKPGEIVPNSGDIRQRVAEFVAIIEKTQDINNFLEYIYSIFSILNEKDEDMIISRIKKIRNA